MPRVKACAEIIKRSEAATGLTNLTDASPGSTEALANLFQLFRSALPLFRDAIMYFHPYYGKKHHGHRPVKTWAHPVTIAPGTVTLHFRLHRSNNIYTLTLAILIDGKPLTAPRTEAAFFITTAKGTPLYLFSSLRDAGIAFWMEKNKNRITIFHNHFPAFKTEILQPLQQHYEVRETGKKKQPE